MANAIMIKIKTNVAKTSLPPQYYSMQHCISVMTYSRPLA